MSGNPLTPQQFVAKWRGVQLSERASVQEHFLLGLVLRPGPAVVRVGGWAPRRGRGNGRARAPRYT